LRSRFFIGLIVLLGGFQSAFADDQQEADTQRQRGAVQQEIAKVQKQLERDQARGDTLQRELRAIERQSAKLGKENRALARQEAEQHASWEELKGQRIESQKALHEERKALAKQLRSAYLAGHSERLSLVLSQDDPAVLGRVLNYHDYVNRARLQQLETVNDRVTKLTAVETKLQLAAKRLSRLRQQQDDNAAKLKRQRASRQAVLAKQQATISSREQQLGGLKAQEAQLQQLLASLREAIERAPPPIERQKPLSLTKRKGTLHMPVAGRVRHNYGESRMHGKMRWRGLQLAAKRGADVKAIAPGQVVFSDWLGRHGLMVIIDHGHGYLSLYGQGETSFAEVGDWVDEGSVIATAGDSGGQSESGLYFEVRYKGEQRDPRTWCQLAAR
jgi:septal ring factor EnvC (AmiA/AmiB activator)